MMQVAVVQNGTPIFAKLQSHHSAFYRLDALPAAQTNSLKSLKAQ